MGDASWFLRQRYEWHNDEEGRVSCHISQLAMIEGTLKKHNRSHCNDAQSPYISRLNIDRIEHDGKNPSAKENLVRKYQSIVGSINWLTIITRPDINTMYSLLSQFNLNPSQGYLDTAKYILRYLKHTSLFLLIYRLA